MADNNVTKSIAISIYINFTTDVIKKKKWKLLPNNKYFDEDTEQRYAQFTFEDVKEHVENNLNKTLESKLKDLTNNNTIVVKYEKTKLGSIEVILMIYGAYASISDFIETTKTIRNFIQSNYQASLNTEYGDYFDTKTTIINGLPTLYGFNIETFMLILTLSLTVATFGVLLMFSYNFIYAVFISSLVIAGFLALIIEISKITTTYYLIYEKLNSGSIDKAYVRSSRIVRYIAIVLSGFFCLFEVAKLNTNPNLEKIKTEKLQQIEVNYKSDSLRITNQYSNLNNILNKQVGKLKPNTTQNDIVVDYSTIASNNKTINAQVKDNVQKQSDGLSLILQQKEEAINNLENSIKDIPEVNNAKINAILTMVFNLDLNEKSYSWYYRLFVVVSSLIITIIVEMISIISLQHIGTALIRKR